MKYNDKQVDELITPLLDCAKTKLVKINDGQVNKDYLSGYNDGMYNIGKELIKRILQHQEVTMGQMYLSDLLKIDTDIEEQLSQKSKADNLVTKFHIRLLNGKNDTDNQFDVAKKCAADCVGEIIEALNHLPTNGYGLEYQDVIIGWKAVKENITKAEEPF